MTSKQIRLLIGISIIVAAAALAINGLGKHTHDATLRGWYENAGGYAQAVAEHQRSGKPMAVYFYTHWCESCKTFRETVLTAAPVKSYLLGYLTVHVDLEAGPQEAELGREFGVPGFPAFYVRARIDSPAVNILQSSNLSPEGFIKTFEDELRRQST